MKLSKLLVLSASIKAGSNLYKLKNNIRQIVYLLYQQNEITETLLRSLKPTNL